MVSLNQIETGIARYLDAALAPKIPTDGAYGSIKKVVFLTGATYLVRHSKELVRGYLTKPELANMGLTDGSGNVDLDGVIAALKEQVPESGLKVQVPLLNEIVFYHSDIDTLQKYIMGATV